MGAVFQIVLWPRNTVFIASNTGTGIIKQEFLSQMSWHSAKLCHHFMIIGGVLSAGTPTDPENLGTIGLQPLFFPCSTEASHPLQGNFKHFSTLVNGPAAFPCRGWGPRALLCRVRTVNKPCGPFFLRIPYPVQGIAQYQLYLLLPFRVVLPVNIEELWVYNPNTPKPEI